MKFNLYYHKTANLFHFVANLSNWNLGCDSNLNRAWVRKTGKLTEKERNILGKIARIISAYGRRPETKSYLAFLFFTPDEGRIWSEVGKLVSANELETIRDSFRVFETRFNVVWQEEKDRLAQWAAVLNEHIANPELRSLERDIRAFFRRSKPDPNLNVCLLLSGGGGYGGNNQGYLTVALRCSAVPPGTYKDVIAVLYHESCHAFYQRPTLDKIFAEFMKELRVPLPKVSFISTDNDLWLAIGEAVVSNLLPEGYLANKYFDRPLPAKPKKGSGASFGNWRLYCATQMFDATRNYIEKREPLDTGYIKQIWETLKDFAEEYPSK